MPAVRNGRPSSCAPVLPGLLLPALLLSACSGVNFHTSPELDDSSRTGVRFYSPKPYLLVARTQKKDEPISVEVIYLPDLTAPQYATHRRGMGSTQISLKLANGVLTDFGQTTDSKLAETLTAMTGGLKSIAEAVKIQRERELLAPQALDRAELQAAAARLKSVAQDIRAALPAYRAETSTDRAETLGKLAEHLELQAGHLDSPDIAATIGQVVENLKAASKRLEELLPATDNAAAKKLRGQMTAWQKTLLEIAGKFEVKAPPAPIVELYEFVMASGGTTLRKVEIPN